jgi:hypothetical protein
MVLIREIHTLKYMLIDYYIQRIEAVKKAMELVEMLSVAIDRGLASCPA